MTRCSPPCFEEAPPPPGLQAWLVLGGEDLARPSRSRLALAVYQQARATGGAAPQLLLSGASRIERDGRTMTEADCMADFLLRHGVDAGDLHLEDRATNTLGNMVFGRRLADRLGLPAPGIITDGYHARRCAWLHRRVFGRPAPALLCSDERGTLRLRLREPLAAAWMAWRLRQAGVVAGDSAAHGRYLAAQTLR